MMSENNNPVSIETWIETEAERLYTKYKQLHAEYKHLDDEHGEYTGGVRQYIDERLGIIEKYKQLIVERERLDDEYKRLDGERKRIHDERKRLDSERDRLDDEYKRLDAKRSELLDSEQLDDEDVDHFEEFELPFGGSRWSYVEVQPSEIWQAHDTKCGRYIVARERLKLIINRLGNWLDAERERRVTSTLKQFLKDYLTNTEDIESVIQIIRIRQAYNMEYLAYAHAEGIEGIVEDIEGIARFLFSGNIRKPKNIDEYGNPDWEFEELEHKIRSSDSYIWIKLIIAEVWRLDLDDETKGEQSDQ